MVKEYLTLKAKSHIFFTSIDIGPNSQYTPSLDCEGKSPHIEIENVKPNIVYIRPSLIGNCKYQRAGTLSPKWC